MANRIKIYNGSGFIDADVSTIGGHSPSEFAKKSHTHNFGTDITNRGEAFLDWGGKNFAGTYGPIDAAIIPILGANRFAFALARGITVEYSRDNGATWTDYESTNDKKVTIFSGPQITSDICIGKPTYNSSTKKWENTSINNRLRIIVDTNRSTGSNIYTDLNKFVFFISTNGSSGCKVTIDAQTKANNDAGNDTWTTFANGVDINGWTGYNVVNTSVIRTYGNSSAQYTKIRFTFYCTGNSSMETYGGLQIINIYGFGGMGWWTPSNMARWGNVYTYDANQNVIFPGNITSGSLNSYHVYPRTNNTYSLGSNSYRWAGVNATTIYENGAALNRKYLGISSNAVSATKATQDGDGNVITSTYETKNEVNTELESKGWYRVAEYNKQDIGIDANSCELIIKRVYSNGNNEYHQIQFLSTYNNQSFKSIDKSNNQYFTKIRYVIEPASNKSYLEVYYSLDKSNGVHLKVKNGKDRYYNWSVITPVATAETVNGVTITTTYDIPANANPVNSLDIPTKVSDLTNDSNFISGNVVSNISSQYDEQDIPTAKFVEDYVANKVPSKTTTIIFNTLTSLNTNATAVGVFTTKSITLTESVQSGDKLKVYLCGNSYYEQYCAGIIEFELFNPSTSSDRNMVSGAGMIMPTIGEQKFIVSASVQNTMPTTTSLSIVVYTLSATNGAPAGANNINVLKVERIR